MKRVCSSRLGRKPSPAVRQAFSDAVVAALLRFDPDALRCKETAA